MTALTPVSPRASETPPWPAFTLRDLLINHTQINVGGVTLSDFANNGPTNVSTQFILIETVEGSSPGINISLDPRVANTIGATPVGILFEATTSGSILGRRHDEPGRLRLRRNPRRAASSRPP